MLLPCNSAVVLLPCSSAVVLLPWSSAFFLVERTHVAPTSPMTVSILHAMTPTAPLGEWERRPTTGKSVPPSACTPANRRIPRDHGETRPHCDANATTFETA